VSEGEGPGRYLSRGYQGAVYLSGEGDDRVVVKQPMGRRLVRRLRVWMLRREYAAYQRLGGIDGIPGCRGLRPDGSLVLTYVAAEPYRESLASLRDREAFFAALLGIIRSCHAAGVAHADLKRRGNILVDHDGRPWVLDFGSAILAGAQPDWLFRLACRMDLNAWIKLKYRRRYDLISPEDLACYQPTWIESAARVLRRVWRKLTGRRWRKARRQRRAGG
jgi:RIO-like serine/threonine protein kinase